MPRSWRCLVLLLGCAALGCNQCGERRRLFPGLRERFDRDDEPARSSDARRNGAAGKDCGPDGTPVSRNNGFGGATLGYPGDGGIIYTGPSYPAGQPYPSSGNPRSDELPQPGGYIPNTNLPMSPLAPNRAIEGIKYAPKSGGTMTGDPKK